MKLIPLTRGFFATVSDEDYERVSRYKWHAILRGTRVYAACRFGDEIVPLHRFLLDPPPGMHVDHIDGDGLNNQRTNLRICTQQENNRAFRRKSLGKTSQFRGVSWDRARSKWRGTIEVSDKHIFLGRFLSEVEAALAYDRAARRFGFAEEACNFPAQKANAA